MTAKVKRTPGPGAVTLEQTLAFFQGSNLRIGILDGTKKKKDAEGAEVEETIGEIAAKHEFGLGVPERSFLRSYFHEHNATVAEAATRLFKSRGPKRETLEVLGQWIVGQIQTRMSNRIPPPLALATLLARKHGGDVPLIDTGQLRSSITYKAEVGR